MLSTTVKLRMSLVTNSTLPPHPCAVQDRPPFICAHGGDTTQHPPNTAAAYKAALQAGADCMEIDAALTADYVLVALHDRDLQTLLDQQTAKVCLGCLTGGLLYSWAHVCCSVTGRMLLFSQPFVQKHAYTAAVGWQPQGGAAGPPFS